MFPRGSSSLPNVSNALTGWEQQYTMQVIKENVIDQTTFESKTTFTTFSFRGVIQPESFRELMLHPEGEREWEYLTVHSKTKLGLKNQDYIMYNNTRYRVINDYPAYKPYGYYQYKIVRTYT